MIDEMENTTPTEPVVEDPVEETPVTDPETTASAEPETVEDPVHPMEVVSVDELLERVAANDAAAAAAEATEENPEETTEETTEEEVTEEPETYTEVVEVVADDTHYFLTTDFADFTVTEGLLLCIFLVMFLKIIGGAIKEGFYWLW